MISNIKTIIFISLEYTIDNCTSSSTLNLPYTAVFHNVHTR